MWSALSNRKQRGATRGREGGGGGISEVERERGYLLYREKPWNGTTPVF